MTNDLNARREEIRDMQRNGLCDEGECENIFPDLDAALTAAETDLATLRAELERLKKEQA